MIIVYKCFAQVVEMLFFTLLCVYLAEDNWTWVSVPPSWWLVQHWIISL